MHAAEQGLPILGDTLYGGQPWRRLCLHAAELQCAHPVSGKTLTFAAPADFQSDPPLQRRLSMIDLEQSNAFRMVHGSADAWSGWYLDRLGDYLLAQLDRTLSEDIKEKLSGLQSRTRTKAIYCKTFRQQLRGRTRDETSAQLVLGNAASERFVIMENRVKFEISFNEGYSHGLFLDQRENRRRLLTGHIAAGFSLLSGKALNQSSFLPRITAPLWRRAGSPQHLRLYVRVFCMCCPCRHALHQFGFIQKIPRMG